MIKFAVLTPGLSQPGGAERTILIQARYADPVRMQCAGIALSGYGGLDEALGRELLRYAEIHGDTPRGRWQRPKTPMVKTVHRTLNDAVRHVCKEADVLITWGALAMATHTAGLEIPVVSVSHTDRAIDAAISGITHLVAVSETGRRYFATALEGALGADLPPVVVIPNGVEVDRACPRKGRAWQREQWGVGPDDKVLLYLGRQAMSKNPWAAIETLARLPSHYRLIMIGNQAFHPDQPLPRVVDLVAKLGLGDRVKFSPPIPYVGDTLAGADCLLHLSLSEADSLVVKEAFIAGLPVVHTPVGSIPEMEAEFGQVGWGVPLRAAPVPAPAPRRDELGPGNFGGEPVALGPKTYGDRPADPLALSVDPGEAVAAIRAALSDDARPVLTKMRAVALERWTGAAMCERWADYLEGVVGQWS
jgi:glycosyltransferase involved in cell wall biosynthesis